MKDIKPLLLILLSIGLVGTWVFHLYDKAQYSTQIASASTVDSAAVERNIRDSLQQAYAQAISNLDFKLDSSQITADSDRKSTRLNSSHVKISYAVFCLKKKI